MNDFDSLGARQQPKPERNEVGLDWQDNPIFIGDSYYLTSDGYVHEDDLLEYAQQHYPRIVLGGI